MELKAQADGVDEVLKFLDDLPKVAESVIDKALVEGAEFMAERIRSNFESFKDTGASIEEVTVSEPFTQDGVRMIKIHWHGSKNRYRIIHLNEWGTVRVPNPRGKGSIQSAMREGESRYFRILKEEIEKGMR